MPRACTTSSNYGLSVTYVRSAKYPIKKARIDKKKLLVTIRAFWCRSRYFCRSAKDPDATMRQRITMPALQPYFFSISSNFSTLSTVPLAKFILMYPVNFLSMRALIISTIFCNLSIVCRYSTPIVLVELPSDCHLPKS